MSDGLAVASVDGEVFQVPTAREHARKYEWLLGGDRGLAGFALLPLFWAVNVWLFWPTFRSAGGDPVVKRYTRLSAACFAASCALFLPWLLAFSAGGPAVVGRRVFDALDATKLDIWGVLTGGA